MAPVKPLRLKSERVQAPKGAIASSNPCCEVLVDTGVYHLDGSYTYLVSQNLSDTCHTGTRVQVPFNGRELEGIVVRRFSSDSIAGFKPISKVLTPFPVASHASLELIIEVAKHWAAHPYDVIRSAIPARVAAVDKKMWKFPVSKEQSGISPVEYLQLPPSENPFMVTAKFVIDAKRNGSVLIIVPDSRSIARLLSQIPTAIVIDSLLERTQRYENFLRAKYSVGNIVIGTRSAIFADIPDLERVVIFDEGSENYYEPRTPGWNVRDVALIRVRLQKFALNFLGYAPSIEMSALIENQEITLRAHEARLSVTSFQPEFAELLPGRVINEIKTAVARGPVLMIAPRKGYAQGIQCSKCRNVALCACGGRYFKDSASAPLECSLCGTQENNWQCTWCKGVTPFLLSRGSARFVHEIGKAIPGIVIASSEGDRILDDANTTEGIIVATPGSAPYVGQGYSAVVFLEAESLLSQADLRAQERARNIIFLHSALVSRSGRIFLILNHENPLIGSLSSWKPSLLSNRDLRERLEVSLPPFMQAVAIDIEVEDSTTLVQGLKQAQKDSRIPETSRILGPSLLKSGLHRVLILTPRESASILTELIHEFQRRRSASGKRLLSMRIDPYSLSR